MSPRGGERLEKCIPGKSICNKDSTSSGSEHMRTSSAVHHGKRKLHEKDPHCSGEGTLQLFVPAKNLLSRPQLKEMGHSISSAQTTARTNYSN